MIPATFDYVQAASVDEALKALAAGDGSKVVAGGHSLIPLLRFRMADTPRLVDIGRLAELKGVRVGAKGVTIGAATTYRDLLESDALAKSHPIIAEATADIADVQVRNRGTIGGGLAHADPASDMPAVMLALDASFTLRSTKGERTVAAREFFIAPFTTAMDASELLTEISLPPLPAGTGTAYESFEQSASGYALAGAAAVVTRSGGKVTHAALAFTGLTDTPFLAAAADKLVGTSGDADAVSEVSQSAVGGVDAMSDIHAPADYRLHLGAVAARRALANAIERGG